MYLSFSKSSSMGLKKCFAFFLYFLVGLDHVRVVDVGRCPSNCRYVDFLCHQQYKDKICGSCLAKDPLEGQLRVRRTINGDHVLHLCFHKEEVVVLYFFVFLLLEKKQKKPLWQKGTNSLRKRTAVGKPPKSRSKFVHYANRNLCACCNWTIFPQIAIICQAQNFFA